VLTVTGFVLQDGRLFAVAHYAGSIVDDAGNLVLATVTKQGILLPTRIRKSTDQMLRIEIGPLPVDLFGVRGELMSALFAITAESGSGSRLRHFLQVIAQILSRGPITGKLLSRVTELLNQLLEALYGTPR
jgi:hypothetical protein